ncbi:IS110 family transposase [Streptomyces sp. NBC_00053]|uniref:IS110 family transposase n=1 Tax=unclassified Streptomyces TaxID=2593676 RepID=UPI002258793D|nr:MULTISPECIES: IS110 family transposase [unclassified Streptomyces]MCX5103228.1 IS110 family transposase [Streptomyces sp. NBC_00439]MCX5505342.1 IS110 family transposase [Streptomyces sp. NBC_00052]MCX5546119.1 IS110 family transposase [Streptomyces sp. NBC_00051]WSP44562.1 IS110 family transposase [Streptomyces sp. NBC_01243]
MSTIFCGIDWAEGHHDIALVDQNGTQVAKLRISDDSAGFQALTALLAQHGDTAEAQIPVAIETPRGLLVACLRATGRQIYAINPLAAARYRDRGSVSRAKSDAADARVLANILRTDRHAHRPLPADSEAGQAVAALARAHQDAVWDRQQMINRLRSHLREYYPAALVAFHGPGKPGLDSPRARMILAAAPTPTDAAKLTRSQLRALLKRTARPRCGIDTEVERLREIFRADSLRQLPKVELALGHQAAALIQQLDAACNSVAQLAAATEEAFLAHPDTGVITSFPGLSVLSGARVLAEIGDDRERFADARAVKAYAGAAPVTRASGRSHVVVARTVKNQRLAAAGYMWAFAALRTEAPRAHYDRRRAGEERHTATLRNLFNKLLGCLYHCLQNRAHYDPDRAFAVPLDIAA